MFTENHLNALVQVVAEQKITINQLVAEIEKLNKKIEDLQKPVED
jgi:uncharacterized coiled-coil protein SlyX